VAWLPPYHDMGLIGAVLQPIFGGFPCVLMPPTVFLQRPYRWLQAISRFSATTSGGPNFAYDLCAARTKPAELASLDLSNWRVAFNAAEPIRRATLERFAAAFAPAGFRPDSFYPCYGLAEATLMVSGGATVHPGTKATGSSAISCGRVVPDSSVMIVDPESRIALDPGHVGEIWVSGPGVARGYWNKPDEMKKVFGAHLANTGEGPFLRTGDLGFIEHGELHVHGRLKDLIIIKGCNHYPEDIEQTVENSHPALRRSSGAVFSMELAEEERVVVVHEIDCRTNPELGTVIGAIRQAVSEEHGVQVCGVVLIKPGSLPRTSSSKIQRRACHDKLLAGTLEVVSEWSARSLFRRDG